MMMHRPARYCRHLAVPRRAVAGAVFLVASLAVAGVQFGDAVPAIVRAPDLEVLKDHLNLSRFSVIAAVRLGGLDGRELIIAEPPSDKVLEQVEESCEAELFCVDPYGFVAGRVHIVHLRDRNVAEVVTIDSNACDRQGRIFAPASFEVPGRLVGWNGFAEAASGHVVLNLTPIVQVGDHPVRAGDPIPFMLMWDEEEERFALYECTVDEDDVETCEFYRDESE